MHDVNIMAPNVRDIHILYIRLESEKYKTRQLFGLVCGRLYRGTMRIHFHFTFTRLISPVSQLTYISISPVSQSRLNFSSFQALDGVFPS